MYNPIIPFYRQLDKLIVRSENCFFYDSDGKKYIDFESGDWAAVLGHTHGRVNRAIKDQLELLMHDGLRFRNKPAEDLALRLLDKLTFEKGQCTFLNSGSEAVNLAITLARHLTKRDRILKVDNSYLSAYGFGQVLTPNNDLLNIKMDDLSSLASIEFKNIAAFVFEPGNARGLIKYPSNEFIKAVAAATIGNGGFLIANEVTTGFGRTGKWFGFQHYDFKPDMVAMGKALGNGYPISCLAINRVVSGKFEKDPFRYAQSHQNDALGCRVGLEVISILEEEGMVEISSRKGDYLTGQLLLLQKKHPANIKEVRGRGLMTAIELASVVRTEEVYMNLIEKGFLVGCRDNVLRFMPPLTIELAHIDSLIAAIDELIE